MVSPIVGVIQETRAIATYQRDFSKKRSLRVCMRLALMCEQLSRGGFGLEIRGGKESNCRCQSKVLLSLARGCQESVIPRTPNIVCMQSLELVCGTHVSGSPSRNSLGPIFPTASWYVRGLLTRTTVKSQGCFEKQGFLVVNGSTFLTCARSTSI